MPSTKNLTMRVFFFLLITCLSIGLLHSQDDENDILEGIKARNIGPAGMSGRVTAIDVVRHDPSHIIIGTASGGVWESRNGGVNWTPLFDEQPSLAIGAVKIDQNNTDIIWVGTGEGNPRNSHNSGAGIFKSIDGGRTWTSMGLSESRLIHRIIIDPRDDETVYAGVLGSAWGDSEDRGLYKSTDGGSSWEKILYVNPSTGVGEMVMDPSNPNKLLVAMWDFRRTPWDFRSGGPGSGLYLTHDGGKSWKELGKKEGLPKGELGRMGLAFATNKPDIVYALIEAKKNGLYKSEDGGHSWKLVSSKDIGNRPFYYSEIYVDPSNENRIFNLWSYVSLSEDGGRSFKTIMNYGNSIHPDHHAFYIHPDNTDFLINGNDGGLNTSYDGGKTWSFAGNLPVGQFYHINYDTAFPYNVYGGMQDNGSWIGPHKVLRSGGIRNDDWQELYFGDGFDVVPILSDDRYGYVMYQGGNVAIYDRKTGRTKPIKPVATDSVELRFNWNAAIAADPFSPDALYFGSQFVHHSADRGESWEIISPDLTTNDTSKQEQHRSGGLTADVTKAENHTTILCISPSAEDRDVIWVGTDDGRLHITTDGGDSWDDITANLPGFPDGAWIPQIELGSFEGEAFVVVNDYRRNNWQPFLYHTSDYGNTFTRVVDTSDVTAFVCSVVQDDQDEDLLFLGTDAGLYYSVDKGMEWHRWPKNLPHVQIRDMKIHPKTNDLILGTFGRAIWIIDDISFMRHREIADNATDHIQMFPSGETHQTYSASYQGVRFYAQGQFLGNNERRDVAKITYHYSRKVEGERESDKPETEGNGTQEDENDNKGKKGEKKKVKVVVLDEGGDTVRNFSFKPKEGINRFYWRLDRNGVRGPSRFRAKEDRDPPPGRWVLPGDYTLVTDLNGEKDTTYVTVLRDPRVDFDLSQALAKNAACAQVDSLSSRARKVTETLLEVKDNMAMLTSGWKYLPDSISAELKKEKKKVLSRLDSLMIRAVGEEDPKGIVDNSYTLRSHLSSAKSLYYSSDGEPGTNALTAYETARTMTNDLIDRVNLFLQEDWYAFREKVVESEPSWFGEYLEIKNIE